MKMISANVCSKLPSRMGWKGRTRGRWMNGWTYIDENVEDLALIRGVFQVIKEGTNVVVVVVLKGGARGFDGGRGAVKRASEDPFAEGRRTKPSAGTARGSSSTRGKRDSSCLLLSSDEDGLRGNALAASAVARFGLGPHRWRWRRRTTNKAPAPLSRLIGSSSRVAAIAPTPSVTTPSPSPTSPLPPTHASCRAMRRAMSFTITRLFRWRWATCRTMTTTTSIIPCTITTTTRTTNTTTTTTSITTSRLPSRLRCTSTTPSRTLATSRVSLVAVEIKLTVPCWNPRDESQRLSGARLQPPC